MKRRNSTIVTQIVSFSIILHLMNNGYAHIAIPAMIILSALSVMFGRVFCGYLCPMRAMERLSMKIRKVAGMRQAYHIRPLPAWISIPVSLLLLVLMVLQAASPFIPYNLQAPVLFFGFFVVFVIPGTLWHNSMCPFSILMKCPARSRPGLPSIDEKTCKKCKKCIDVCPTDAIATTGDMMSISEKRCILCYRCEQACPFDAIK